VGLHMLTEVISTGHIAGIDPSQAMLDHARRRN
jgi:ubiquinone/menaquinone biosynthesis C-methylase UbiE